MKRTRPLWAPLVLTLVLTGCREGVQKAVLENPKGTAGAASAEELSAAYSAAHRKKDVARVRELDLSMCQLQGWVPTPARQKAALEGLFALDLETARLVAMPADAPEGCGVFYLRQAPQGHPAVDCSLSGDRRCGKLVLAGKRPDGTATQLDPGLVVVQAQGRYYLDLGLLVAEDAAQALRSGSAPRCRPLPLGSDFQTSLRVTGKRQGEKTWEGANKALDELEREVAQRRGQ